MIQIRIANAMGLDSKSSAHGVAITEALFGVEDTEAFYQYLSDKKSSIEYETKPERLLTLSRMYKKLQDQAKLPTATATSFTNQLTHKVSECRTFVKNQIELGNRTPFSMITVQGDKYFTIKELKALHALGSPAMVVELSEQHKLSENLMALFMSKFKSKANYEVLTDNQQRVKQLVKETL